jgi:hypothetical protein
MATVRRVLGIEAALHRTFVHELPKQTKDRGRGRPPTGFPSVSPMFAMAVLGTAIDFSREPGFPMALGDPHPDALLIEQAVRDMTPGDLDISDVPLGLDELVAPARSGPARPYLDVAKLKSEIRDQAAGHVVMCARLGSRPALLDAPVPEAILGNNNRPIVCRTEERVVGYVETRDPDTGALVSRVARTVQAEVTCHHRGKAGYPLGAFSPLKWSPSPAGVVECRAAYAVWWAALAHLAEVLSRQVPDPTPDEPNRMRPYLSSIVITGPTAARLPWAGEVEKTPRVLPDTQPAIVPAPRRVAPRRRIARAA